MKEWSDSGSAKSPTCRKAGHAPKKEKLMSESQLIEYKESLRDEYLK
jgi:hypothetical protein